MTEFIKYPHLERLGGSEVQDILLGNVSAFYKINGTKLTEDSIVNEFVTDHFVLKEKAKIAPDEDWSNKNIPELLDRVFYELVREEMHNIVKLYKNPTINFKTLRSLTRRRVKKVLDL